MKSIKISGARVHNLKNISCEIPKEKITVLSGISGSGKSSLAFDTIFAEGQRRYVENLSSYAKQVIGIIEKPDVDSIEGIPPAIAIDQKSANRSPRSTVGTLTEVYDYLRLLFSRFGKIHCPECKKELVLGSNVAKTSDDIISKIEDNKTADKEIKIYATVLKNLKGNHRQLIENLLGSKYQSFRIDGIDYSKNELEKVELSKTVPHSVEVALLDFKITNELSEENKRLVERSVKEGFEKGADILELIVNGQSEIISKQPFCQKCLKYFPAIQPRLFSFNSPYGACPSCQGLGVKKEIDPNLVVPNRKLTIFEGAIRPWTRMSGQNNGLMAAVSEVAKKYGFDLNAPINSFSRESLKILLYGNGEFEGVVNNLERKYRETESDYLRQEIEQYMIEKVCDECSGERINEFARSVYAGGYNISAISNMEVPQLARVLEKFKEDLPKESHQILNEILKRLKNLQSVGLGYLAMSRSSVTLSGGEAQRIKLGVQFDSFLSGALYVLDEPTISLHSADTQKLITAFERLKEEGNTVVIVEHDRAVLESADYIIDIGPGAGRAGGQIIAQGAPEHIKKDPASITGQYLSGKKSIDYPKKPRKPNGKSISIIGAGHNNLKNINVEIPLGLFVCVTGLSGSGKSSLVYDILAKAIAQKLHNSQDLPGVYKEIKGLDNLDKVIKIDQSPIGRTPRSNLATYTGLFTPIRELFAATAESRIKGFTASQFSFNLKGGRCETCRGDGVIKIEMFFMNDVYVPCEECQGRRYNQETLEIKVSGKTIADVLSLSVEEAAEFFKDSPDIMEKISILEKVGLGYLPLGQSATTLSGGEAQRIKLGSELSRPSTGKTIYILDEPTTGLHFEDVNKLLKVLQELVDRGNTVLIIEHNLEIIRSADWVIDLGPGGGADGGNIVAQGTPAEIAKNKKSLTGKFLKELI